MWTCDVLRVETSISPCWWTSTEVSWRGDTSCPCQLRFVLFVGQPIHQQWAICEVRGAWLVLLFGLRIMCQHNIIGVMSSEDEDDFFSWFFSWMLWGKKEFGHAGERFPWRRGPCEGSSELSSFDGSPVPGDASRPVVWRLPEDGKWCAEVTGLQQCLFFLVCRGRNLSSRHMGCRCCAMFRQSGTAGVVPNPMLPRRHCLKALSKQNKFTTVHQKRTQRRSPRRGFSRGGSRHKEVDRLTTSLLKTVVYKELLSTSLQSKSMRQAPRMHTSILAALGRTVCNTTSIPYHRMCSWWALIQNWSTPRFGDHRGLKPQNVSVKGKLILSQADIHAGCWWGSRVGLQTSLHWRCLLRHESWLDVRGLVSLATSGRLVRKNICILRHLPTVRVADVARWSAKQASRCRTGFSAQPVLVQNVLVRFQVTRFWTPHSGRSYLPTATTLVGQYAEVCYPSYPWGHRGRPICEKPRRRTILWTTSRLRALSPQNAPDAIKVDFGWGGDLERRRSTTEVTIRRD